MLITHNSLLFFKPMFFSYYLVDYLVVYLFMTVEDLTSVVIGQ